MAAEWLGVYATQKNGRSDSEVTCFMSQDNRMTEISVLATHSAEKGSA